MTPMPGGHPLLELKAVSRSFGALVVADKVDLRLAPHEALGIIGPNGAGKSTLFNLIAGLLRPASGTILFDGRDITSMPAERRCRAGIGRSFQIPQPFDTLTVFENTAVAAMFGGGMSQAEATGFCGAILELTGLAGKANVLAGGVPLLDRKRLELARALATNPRLLLLDEIAGGLTEAECHVLVETINEIRSRGVAIIWIEHVVHALVAVVDRLVVLDFGRVVAEGAPVEVMRSEIVQTIYMGVPA
jgi:branched-chain amino acid transport system ATP-binding protein